MPSAASPPSSEPDGVSEGAATDLSAAELPAAGLSAMPFEDGELSHLGGHQSSSGEEERVRQQVLACVSAARALLNSEALDCLVGRLWHNRVPAFGGSTDSSCDEECDHGGTDDGAGGRGSSDGSGDSNEGDSSSTWRSGGGGTDYGEDTSIVAYCLRNFLIDLFLVLERSTVFLSGPMTEDPYNRPMDELAVEMRPKGVMLSFFDVPTQAQAEAMAAGLCFLSQMRSLVAGMLSTSAVASDQPPGCVSSSCGGGSSWSRWEVLQAALFRSLPPEQQEDWGRPLWCCNPGCTNLSGPSELQLKTKACGGGCGSRYCDKKCSAQGWRLGHRYSCKEISAGRG